jgi:hypothetical protein
VKARHWALALAVPLLLAAPAEASADVIFDPADADELVAVLAEAYQDQGVCYGWYVNVHDVTTTSASSGSNFGVGTPTTSGTCQATVEFRADITYTSESSESEDSATYDVSSNPDGVTRDDLDSLDIDFGELTGENPDVVIAKAITALPLLAADKGLGKAISAAPATGTTPADAQLTDDPGSDWWRNRGGMLLWGLGLLLAGGVFVWWVLWTRRRRAISEAMTVPDSPAEMPPSAWQFPPATDPPTTPFPVAQPPAAEPRAAEPPTPTTDPLPAEPAAKSSAEKPAAEDRSAAEPTAAKPPSAAEPVDGPVVEEPPKEEPVTGESLAAELSPAEPPAKEQATEEPPKEEPSSAEQSSGTPPQAKRSSARDSGKTSGEQAPSDLEDKE